MAPFCDLLHEAGPTCPRLLLNLEAVGARGLAGSPNGRDGKFASERVASPPARWTLCDTCVDP